MTDAREFRLRSTTFVKALLLTRDNMGEVQTLATEADVTLLFRVKQSKPYALEYTRADGSHHRAVGGCMAVVTHDGYLTTMPENEFLRMFEPHGYIDWTEPRLTPEVLRGDADRFLQSFKVKPDAPLYRIQVDYGKLVTFIAQLLKDVRATGSEAENIRIGYGASCSRYREEMEQAWSDLGEYKDAVRQIKRIVREQYPTQMDGGTARDLLRRIKHVVRDVRVGRE